MGHNLFSRVTLISAGLVLLLNTYFHFSSSYLEYWRSFGLLPWMTSLATILALLVLYQGGEAYVQYLWSSREQEEELERLKKRVELLSALREISLVINEELELKAILPRILHLLHVTFSPCRMAIVLSEKDSLVCKALWEEKSLTYEPSEWPLWLSEGQIHQCIQTCQNREITSDQRVEIYHLLAADREVLGLLYLAWERETSPLDENSLWVLAKHLALAIRKPTLYDRAIVDPLTTLYTKGHFTSQISKLFHMAKRLQQPFSLILLDIDHFKSINDTYGHLTGDLVLHEVGSTVSQSIRHYDSAYRYGGEEMAILLPQTTAEEAWKIAERIRQKVENLSLRSEKGEPLQVTLSAGVCAYSDHHQSFQELISQADEYLYQAKRNGRNQVQPQQCRRLAS